MACKTCGRTDGVNVFEAPGRVTCECGLSPDVHEICGACAVAFPTIEEGEGRIGVLCPHCDNYIGVIVALKNNTPLTGKYLAPSRGRAKSPGLIVFGLFSDAEDGLKNQGEWGFILSRSPELIKILTPFV